MTPIPSTPPSVTPRSNPPRRKLLLTAFALAASVVYCGAAAIAVSALATEPGHTIDASRALDAGPLGAPEIVIAPIPADPAPMVEKSQWIFDLRWDRGEVWLLGVQPLELPMPRETARAMGRFALELYEGPALIERTRFDFPLLGSFIPGDGGRPAASFSQNLRTRIGVVFPATSRGTRLELWDRATNRRWSLPWPPTSPPSPTSPASAPASGPAPGDSGRG
jgi:hypothetical protein